VVKIKVAAELILLGKCQETGYSFEVKGQKLLAETWRKILGLEH
jgi:hypothetical protein